MAMVVFTGPIPLWGRVRERGHMSRDFAREELESLNLRLSLRIIRRRGRATGTTPDPAHDGVEVQSHRGRAGASGRVFPALASWCASG